MSRNRSPRSSILFLFISCAAFAAFSGCVKKAVPPVPPPPQIEPYADKLVIHLPAYKYFPKPYAATIEKYQEEYPQTEVTVEKIGNADDYPGYGSDYQEHIERSLAAGDGPDVILTRYVADLYNSMDGGAFLDLSYYADNDAEFDASGLNAAVYNAGVYRGARCVMPLSYELNILLAVRSSLESIRFDLSRDTDFVSFFNEISDRLPLAKENPEFIGMFDQRYLYNFIVCAGLTVYDRENGNILPDKQAARDFCEAYKPYYPTDASFEFVSGFGFEHLPHGTHYFHIYSYQPEIFYDHSRLKDLKFEPVITAIRTLDGGLKATVSEGIAVRAGAKNAANAWEFIKIMLTEEIQYTTPGSAEGFTSFPVNAAALARQIDTILDVGESIGFGTSDGYARYFCPAVPEEDKAPYRALHDSITDCAFNDLSIESAFIYYMAPYFTDEKSYDECIDEFIKSIEEYLSGAAT